MAKSADPAAMPEPNFYAPAAPPFLGDPETDPVLTVRVRDWERRFVPTEPRAVKVDNSSKPWALSDTSDEENDLDVWLWPSEVATWPIAHPMTYTTAFRHEEARREQEKAATELAGDMGEEAFRG